MSDMLINRLLTSTSAGARKMIGTKAGTEKEDAI